MNNKAITFIKNFSYTLSSNLISLVISAIVILIVPKLIGMGDYGYWQLYLFYVSYVGFLHFGWTDGVYLRYGGEEYKDLNKKLFFSQFWMLFFLQVILGVIIVIFSAIFSKDPNREFIFIMTAVSMLIVNVRLMLIYILQATNRIKEYAQITLIEKVLYCCLILLFLFLGVREFKLLIAADVVGKLIALIFATYCCRDIVFNKISLFYLNFIETIKNVTVGIKLMFANIASMLIIGVVRFGIERTWDVVTFGKISLTLSVSNLLMVFINAIGIILFPVLRRTDESKLPKIYTSMRTLLMVPLLGMLVAYFPLKVILSEWLPQYEDSLIYMALVFPMCVYEGKMALLINTYLKSLRKENLMLKINLTSVVLSFILTFVFTIVFKSLSIAVILIVALLAFRCILAEVLLSKILNVSVYKDIIYEVTITIVFILTGWFLSLWIGVFVYLVTYGLYLLLKKRDILNTFLYVKQVVRR